MPSEAGSKQGKSTKNVSKRHRHNACGNAHAPMIPISDDNPAYLTPFVTWAIIAGCIGVFLWQLSLGRHAEAELIYAYSLVPVRFFAHPFTGLEGAPSPALTLFTSMFLHGSWLHLGGNMLFLWIFGNNVEDLMGHIRYALFYLICGTAAALTQSFTDPQSAIPMLGASGAISGVLAAYVLAYPQARVTVIIPLGILLYPVKIAAFYVVGFWFLLQLLSWSLSNPNQPGVAFAAHIGGFCAGLLLTPIFKSSAIPLFGRKRGPWG
jgi:rhomboid family protein